MRHAVPPLLFAALLLAGCTSIGPQRLGVDRSDYGDHLRETNKQQLLQNIVAMRFGDAPSFLDVSSVIAQYTREGSLHADARIDPSPGADDKATVGGTVLLRESPTVTYTPLIGDRFARSMLAPISPAALLGMIDSGWSPDLLFRLAARSINGIDNGSRDPLFAQRANPAFAEVVAALGRLQQSRALTMRVTHEEAGRFGATATPLSDPTDQDRADLAYLRRVLRLPGDGRMLRIVFANGASAPDELAIGTRSMFEILSELAQGVELPDESRSAAPTPSTADYGAPLIRIHSGKARPAATHVAVRFHGQWYWIDQGDLASKQMFLIAQVLMSLTDTSGSSAGPVVTIPAS